MYQMSHSYSATTYHISHGASPLEYIASSSNTYHSTSSVNPFSYSVTSIPSASTFSYCAEGYQAYETSQQNLYAMFNQRIEYHFQPDNFLKPGKEGMFIGATKEVKQFIEEVFELIFHQSFPCDIKISVCNTEQFRKIAPHSSTIGLSVNRRKQGLLSEIFILNDSLARVMLTIGHELGHVLTETLSNHHDEEAKAYAFSLAWINIIKQYNIANLQEAIITEYPAENGLHDVAFFFVQQILKQGKTAWETYKELVSLTLTSRYSY